MRGPLIGLWPVNQKGLYHLDCEYCLLYFEWKLFCEAYR